MIRLILIEDHALTRAGLRTALAGAGYDVVGEAGDGLAGAALATSVEPDVAIVDLGLPGQDGIAVTRAIKSAGIGTRVLILTMQEVDAEVLAALSAGADGYCVKSSDPAIVVDAVRTVAAGGAYFDPRIAHVVLRRFSGAPVTDSPLTPRELDVLRLVAEGVGNNEIAERLHIGLGTVKGHVRDILEKLAATDRAQAAVTAYRRGILG
jgi:DNA-binding NarL/FixJ family response regulator